MDRTWFSAQLNSFKDSLCRPADRDTPLYGQVSLGRHTVRLNQGMGLLQFLCEMEQGMLDCPQFQDVDW